MKVLVTDGNERTALAITRALGREQVEVIVGAQSFRSLAGASRYCRQRFVYPPPYREPEQFVSRLSAAAREYQARCVVSGVRYCHACIGAGKITVRISSSYYDSQRRGIRRNL